MGAVIVHGGVEKINIPPDIQQKRNIGTKEACSAGFEVLQRTDSAIDAVIAAVQALEDNPLFDAGTGSYYNLCGDIEMDAAIMNGRGDCGAVACIQKVKNPISVARKVMEDTPHVLLVGEGARLFARVSGFADADLGTLETKALLEEQLVILPADLMELVRRYNKIHREQLSFSTVGAVAVDSQGFAVAGTSTGGIFQKLPGRVGDTPIIGAGTFASQVGGASATGRGEEIIKLGVTRAVLEAVARGQDIQSACLDIVAVGSQRNACFGVIALDNKGRWGFSHNGTYMPVSFQSEETSGVVLLD